jgi:predicted kinase
MTEIMLQMELTNNNNLLLINKERGVTSFQEINRIRKELNVSPTEKQGKVVSFAQERAREYLRKKQPFVWNATNITAQTRSMQISLFEAYGASVEVVFLETEWETQMNRNRSRNAIVPTSVIENMLSKLTLPERYESESVLWKTV